MEKKNLVRQRISKGKKWIRPKLIVLAEGKPEESVLMACKDFITMGGPSSAYNACDTGYNPPYYEGPNSGVGDGCFIRGAYCDSACSGSGS